MKNNEQNGTKKSRFNLFDWFYRREKTNDKEGVNALKDPSIINFFKLVGGRFGKLISANLIITFGNFPIFFVLIAMTNVLSESSAAPLYQAWGPLAGAALHTNSPAFQPLFGAFGAHANVSVINTPTIVFFCLGLFILFTWGFTRVGTTYLYRNMMSGEPVFPLSDAWYVIKRNVKQSLLLGIFDALMIAMFAYNIYFLSINYNVERLNAVMLFLTVAMAILYSFARPYAFIMVFTFDLKLTKILKNALYFTILGVKRNLIAFIGILFIVALNYTLFMIFMPLGSLLPFIFTLALCDFAAVYAAYPNIIKYMMDERDAQAIIEKRPLDEGDEEYEENEYEDDELEDDLDDDEENGQVEAQI